MTDKCICPESHSSDATFNCYGTKCECHVADSAQKTSSSSSAFTGGTIFTMGGLALMSAFTGGIVLPIVGGMAAAAGISSLVYQSNPMCENVSGMDCGDDDNDESETESIAGSDEELTILEQLDVELEELLAWWLD